MYTGDLQRYSLCFVSPWSGLELSGATAIGSIHIVKTSHHSTWLHLRGIQLCRSALFLTQEWILQMDFACPEQFLPSRLKKKSATAKRHWLLCQADHRPVSKSAMPIWSECSWYHLLIKKSGFKQCTQCNSKRGMPTRRPEGSAYRDFWSQDVKTSCCLIVLSYFGDLMERLLHWLIVVRLLRRCSISHSHRPEPECGLGNLLTNEPRVWHLEEPNNEVHTC